MIDEILTERQKTHGDFRDHADVTQRIKMVMCCSVKWGTLTTSQRESLEMVAHKIGRILAGNPNHQDHWADIAGYAQLVANQLQDRQ